MPAAARVKRPLLAAEVFGIENGKAHVRLRSGMDALSMTKLPTISHFAGILASAIARRILRPTSYNLELATGIIRVYTPLYGYIPMNWRSSHATRPN
jgi:hypothetical protein